MAYYSNSICHPVHVRCLLHGMKTASMGERISNTKYMPHQVKLFVRGISNCAKPQQDTCRGSWCSELPRDGRNAVLFFQFCFPSDLKTHLIIHSIKG